jgi:hypothetical protein
MVNKWPSPWTILSGILLAISLGKYAYDPLKWVAIGAVAVGIPPIILRAWVSLRRRILDINALMIIAGKSGRFLLSLKQISAYELYHVYKINVAG